MAEAKKCSLCKTADLIPSGCGCLNPACHNFVEKWKSATAGYDPPIEVKPISSALPPAPAPVAAPEVKAETATEEPPKKKRGRPKKIKD